MLGLALDAAAAAAILGAAWGIGDRLLPRRGDDPPPERALLALGLGLGLLPLVVAGVGFAGLLGPLAALSIVGAGLSLAVRPARAAADSARGLRPPRTAAGRLLVLAGATAAVLATVPPVDHDALVYHLGLAGAYAVEGRVFHVPHTIYAGFPQSASALYALCLLLGTSAGGAAKIVSIAHGAVAVGAAGALGRRLAPGAGAWSAALVALSPAFLFYANVCGADFVVAAHAACALLALARGESLLAGLVAGFAAAAKYQGFFVVAAVAAAAAVAAGPRRAALAASAGLLPPLPWLAKNLVATGNPIYPIGSLTPAAEAIVASDLVRYAHPLSLPYVVTVPFRMVLDPARFETSLGPAAVATVVAGAASGLARGGLPRALAAAAAVQTAAWYATLPVARFLFPALVAAAPVAATAIASPRRRLLRVAVVALLLFQFWDTARFTLAYFDPRPVLLGRTSREGHIARANPLARVAPYAAEFLPPDARVLFVGSIRRFPFPRPVIAASPYDEQPIAAYLRTAREVPDLVTRLHEDGITHILVDVEAAEAARAWGALPLDERERALWNALVAEGLVPLRESPPVGLYRLKRPAELATMEP